MWRSRLWGLGELGVYIVYNVYKFWRTRMYTVNTEFLGMGRGVRVFGRVWVLKRVHEHTGTLPMYTIDGFKARISGMYTKYTRSTFSSRACPSIGWGCSKRFLYT